MFRVVLIALMLYTGLQAQVLLPGAPGLAWGATAVVFGLMVGWQMLYRAHAAAVERPWFHWFAWAGSGAFGIWATFVLFSLPVDVAAAVARLLNGPPDFLREGLRGALAAALAVTAAGLWQTLRGPAPKIVEVPVPGLHGDLEGLTIVQISDLHVGPTIRRRYAERVVRRALAAAPDLIAVTGDLADGHPERLRGDTAPLARLAAPLGTYFVTGNHEYYWGGERWIAEAAAFGWTPLIDRNVAVRRGDATLLVAGVADPAARSFGSPQAGSVATAARSEAAAHFRLQLAHRPGVCPAAAAAGFDLQLSGHTHGGQFFPFSLLVRLTHRYHRGLVRLGRMWLYVSAGTGYWGPPHRFWIPAEIAVLRLTKTFPERISSGA
ncbi:MAG: metallophosphoesterase [Ignavibacteria bacterium]